MNPKVKMVLILVLVLFVPGGILAAYFLRSKKKNDKGYSEYVVGSESNNPNQEDHANKQFNPYTLIDVLGLDEDEFIDMNPFILDQDYIDYGTVVYIQK